MFGTWYLVLEVASFDRHDCLSTMDYVACEISFILRLIFLSNGCIIILLMVSLFMMSDEQGRANMCYDYL